ncbi:MAG: hypothetical protein JNK15_24590, partial [Planctomycetes bacterium]|nr:hypothetical protein [Planctomycetota bacterium]
ETEEEPDLAGREPHSQAIVDRIDAEQPPRENHFALRFDATIDVPAAGEWTFTLGSDDSSWLWIDGDKVIQNQGLAPHRRRSGKVKLTAGKHDLRVLFTEAAGGQSLELLWRGPGVDEQPVPKSVATAATVRLQPPPPLPAPEAAAVARGRAAARAARCDACHAIDDAAFAALPAPAAGKPFAELRDAACPSAPAGQSLAALGKDLASRPWAAPERLAVAFVRDGCGSCHVRDGKGGLPAPVRAGLAEVEDLGDEGRVPPDLTAVGRRLRPAWLQKVLATGHSVRPYLRVRMPALGEAKARDYAELFTTVDAAATTVAEPPFSVEAARRGRDLAGVGGRNCVTCHTFQGLAGPGIQGMDLALQYERLNPAWFRDWLLHPTKLRPGTRMPSLWLVDDAEARAEADAIRCWSSLGASAPLPAGLRTAADSLELVASDRPKLHGAFLEGISARCLAVGTPERTHFAFDLVEPRLVWAWRGAFLDGAGTWVGRAGKLVKPLGRDWLVLADFSLEGAARRELVGQRRTPDGYPVLQVRAGDVEYDDEVRARLAANGSELVRTLRVRRGPATFVFPMPAIGMRALVDGAAASRHVVAAGQTLEVVYQW